MGNDKLHKLGFHRNAKNRIVSWARYKNGVKQYEKNKAAMKQHQFKKKY